MLECHAIMPCKNAMQKCHAKMLCNNAMQKCHTKSPCKNAMQKCHTKMPCKNAMLKYHAKMPCKNAIQKYHAKMYRWRTAEHQTSYLGIKANIPDHIRLRTAWAKSLCRGEEQQRAKSLFRNQSHNALSYVVKNGMSQKPIKRWRTAESQISIQKSKP